MSKDASINDFGLVIAFILPGFLALWGTQAAIGIGVASCFGK